ncbi:MAG: trypsin-like peptidase domain-containing protein [Planctomycetes bacterium]|nr:trypsin-like peptidase domain-containing protein [Planctomycetota bacterium]
MRPGAARAKSTPCHPRSSAAAMTNFQSFEPRRPSAMPLVLAGAAFALAAFLVLDRTGVFNRPPSAEPRQVAPRGELAPLERTFVDVFASRSPSIAHITTRVRVRDAWGYDAGTQEGSGSGFVWDDRGTVVTNYHVVKGTQTVKVVLSEKSYTARVMHASPEHDLAVLQLQGSTMGLQPIPLGSSKELKVGQTAIAIGNPFGFDQTMTTGIVSALGRNIRTKEGNVLAGLIQVDAAINPGNSGGPLLDSAGRLIGVTTAIYSPSGASAGIGFAVPVDTVNDIVPALLGEVTAAVQAQPQRAVLGVSNLEEDPRLRSYLVEDLESGPVRGALITGVVPGGGADKAGIRPFEIAGRNTRWGDLIIAVDERPVRSFDHLEQALRGKKPGQVVQVKLVRGLPDAPRLEVVPVTLGAAQ